MVKKRKESIYQYEAIFDPNGSGYTVTVPKLPGLVTEGSNLQEARDMARDAIRCYLEAMLKDKVLHSQKSLVARKRKENIAVGV
ncbi:MAG: type II toxin-antitoxin system HicB family antitoxin [Patescibacteria group bacterium]